MEPSYQGTFTSARRHVFHTFATTHSPLMKKRVSQYMLSGECPLCRGKRLRRESLSIKFAGFDIADISRLPLKELAGILRPFAEGIASGMAKMSAVHPEKTIVTQRIAADLAARLGALLDLGLGYLTLERSTPTLSPGELQRLRLATQIHSNLFGVVYVLDEPSAGLHPADTEALLSAFERLRAAGNSLFVVEHDLDVIRRADWIVDVGPAAGEHGGHILYSGVPAGLERVEQSQTRRYLFGSQMLRRRTPRPPRGWLQLKGVTRNNLKQLDVAFPLGVFTTVTGVSGSGKSSLVSQALVELLAGQLGHTLASDEQELEDLERPPVEFTGGQVVGVLHTGLIRHSERPDAKDTSQAART
jgi:excinuclease ABC subunit A